ncbi:MAG: hypothetical protein JO064_09350 [Actinobacteria bacterium]|nr:hypothetical protein [Actinomycetota bacterium]
MLGLLALGCGLLLEFAGRRPLPGPLLVPAGFALLAAVLLFPVVGGGTAPLATPLAVVLAVAGYAAGWRRLRRADPAAVRAAVATFAVFAAPVVCSGRRTFAGYIKLDDTATYFAMLDRAMAHGYGVAGLAPSTYDETLRTSLVYGYPLGSLVPLGVGRALVAQDLAWVWQPYLTFLAALLALALYQLTARFVRSRWLRAAVAFLGAQAALLYGYAMWGGVKELATAVLVVTVAALAAERVPPLLALAVCGAAVLGALSAGGVVWLAVPAVVVALRQGRRWSATLVVATAALAIPTLYEAPTWLSHTGAFTGGSEYGNLGRRIGALQVFGIWPSGDFRVDPVNVPATDALIAVAAVAVVVGAVLAWRRRATEMLVALGMAVVGCAVYAGAGSPWVGGKALASASPVVFAVGLAGAAWLAERRIVASLGLAALAGGVLWSNVLQYHAVSLAPSGILGELEQIGNRYAGDGPTLLTDYQPYGARHFLRRMDAEAAGELRYRQDPLRSGGQATLGVSVDVDELQLPAVLQYRTLVLRRSPLASRPPSVYSLVWSGRYYDVWRRRPGRVLAHLSLGSRFEPGAEPSCARVLALAREAKADGGRLATVARTDTVVLEPNGRVGPPATLGSYGEDPFALYLARSYTVTAPVDVSTRGSYDVFVGGTFQGRVEVTVDGRRVGSARDVVDWPSTFVPLGAVSLAPGRHMLTLRYRAGGLAPGSAGTPEFGFGPVALGIGTAARSVTYVRPAAARTLCGKLLDWVEVVGP